MVRILKCAEYEMKKTKTFKWPLCKLASVLGLPQLVDVIDDVDAENASTSIF